MSNPAWTRSLARKRRKSANQFRPQIEGLEERITPATFFLTNSNNDLSAGSLRLAITQANNTPGADTIDTITRVGNTLSFVDVNLNLAGTPLPTITDDLSIVGHTGSGFEVGRLIVSGNDESRVLSIAPGVNVSITGTTIKNGEAVDVGGGIYNQGRLTLSNSTIINNEAASGGGIYNSGTLTISGSTISGNHADNGAGIFNVGPLSISSSTISGNQAGVAFFDSTNVSNGIARGGGLYSQQGDVAFDRVTIVGNVAKGGSRMQGDFGYDALGGGIYLAAGTGSFVDSTIHSNTALGGNGADGAAGPAGTPAPGPYIPGQPGGNGGNGLGAKHGGAALGGGIYSDATSLTFVRSTISGNNAEGGVGGTGGAGGAGADGAQGRHAVSGTGGDILVPAGVGGRGGNGGSGGVGGIGGDATGGGLYFNGTTMIIVNSTYAGNKAEGGRGGAGGRAGQGGNGGGGGNGAGSLMPPEGNDGGVGGDGGTGGTGGASGSSRGGGLFRARGDVVTTNVTMADNRTISIAGLGGDAGLGGFGGIAGFGTVMGSPGANGISGPAGAAGATGASSGGGFAAGLGNFTGSTVFLANTIVARNFSQNVANDVSGNIDTDSTHNLIGTGGSGDLINGTNGNLVGIANPGLGPMANNGGPTTTFEVLLDSPALNAGDNALAIGLGFQPLTTDQRGTGFARIVGTKVDIGAYENANGAESLIVTTLTDENDGTSDPTKGTGTSLREAIAWANLRSTADTITFASALSGGVITLGGTQLPIITDDLKITGLGALQLTISGNDASRVFEIAEDAELELSAIAISNGSALEGGGIYNAGTLKLLNAVLSNNEAVGSANAVGGGLFNVGTATVTSSTFSDNSTSGVGGGLGNTGTLTLITSTLVDNTAAFYGGAIDNDGTLNMNQSTLADNSAVFRGGGISNAGGLTISGSTLTGNSAEIGGGLWNFSAANLINSTLVENTATNAGAGIYNFGNTVTIHNSTLTRNRVDAGGNGAAIWTFNDSGTFTRIYNSIVAGNLRGAVGSTTANEFGNKRPEADSANNLIGSTSSAGGMVNGVNGNLVGVDPKLGPLADNGGPTQTVALLEGSPAIHAGSNALIAAGSTTDQRGFSRIDGVAVDMGACERQGSPPELTRVRDSLIVAEGSLATNTFIVEDPDGFETVRTVTASLGTIVEDQPGLWAWSYTPPDGPYLTTVTITATDNYGLTATSTFTLQVYNVVPRVAISGATSVNEGAAYTLNLGTVTDPGQDTISRYVVHWGDGVSVSTFFDGGPKTFIYEDGSRNRDIYVFAYDEDGTHQQSTQIRVAVSDVAPTAAITGAPATSHSPEGTAITLGSTVTDPSVVDTQMGFAYAWAVSKNGNAYASGTDAEFTFTPEDNGTYIVSLTATDWEGVVSQAAQTTITVDNVAPTTTITGLPASGRSVEGAAISLGSSVTDPSSPDVTAGFTYAWSVTKNGGAYASGSSSGIVFTPNDNGSYVVALTATDKDGSASLVTQSTIVVDNVVPNASITGAPISGHIVEGSAISLGGVVTDSSSLDTAAGFTYAWTVSRNGSAYTTGSNSNLSFTPADSGTYAISLTATDKDGGVSTAAQTTIVVDNVVPVVTLNGTSSAVRGQTNLFTLAANDLSPSDQAAGFIYTINWGDGSPLQTIPRVAGNASGVSLDHIFKASGSYSVSVTATDQDGGVSTAVTRVVNISDFQMQGSTLVVGGTTGNDDIRFIAAGGSNLMLLLNYVYVGTFAPTGVVAFGQSGADILVATGVAVPAWLYGGSGNDTIFGGSSDDVLVGDEGVDMIMGGAGRNLLIGGADADVIYGDVGDDILIAGATSFDGNQVALAVILAEWASPRTYEQRVANIRGSGTSSRANGEVFLKNSGTATTVFDDGGLDQLIGSVGRDWYFANLSGGTVQDFIGGLETGEINDELTIPR